MKTTHLTASSLATILLALPLAGAWAQDADAPPYLQMRDVSHGDVSTLLYQSESLGKQRKAIVYLPPGYYVKQERYPVLYLLHGAGGDERSWVDQEQANVILDNLIADGRLEPLVVVMPYGYTRELAAGERRRGADGYKTDMEEFMVDFTNDLIPAIESRYKVLPGSEYRAIAGLSMGGGQSLAIGLSHPEMFHAVASFSAAMQIANDPSWGGIDMEATLTAKADAINEHLGLLWVGCGTEDTLFNVNQTFSGQLNEHKIEHVFRVSRGAHEPAVWSRYLYEVAPELF